MDNPKARVGMPAGPRQSWFELFYDLAFVAAIVVVSNTYSKDYSLGQVGWLVVVFSLIWSTWLMATLLLDRLELSGTYTRTLLVAQMALVLVIGIVSSDLIDHNTQFVGPLFALILITFALLNRRARTLGSEAARVSDDLRPRLLIAAVLFIATAIGNVVSVVFWVVGIVFVLSTIRYQPPAQDPGEQHLTHRFGEFTIIMLGETFLKVGLVVSGEPLDRVDLFALPLTFVVITALWWLYFSYVTPGGTPGASRRRREGWIVAHFPLHLFIAALAVGLAKLLLPESPTYLSAGLLLVTIPLVGAVLSVALIQALGRDQGYGRRLWILLGGGFALLGVGVFSYVNREQGFDMASTVVLLTVVLIAMIWLIERGRGRLKVVQAVE